jgi:hypothetical protein
MNGAPPSSSSLTVHHPEVIPLIFSCFHKSNQLLQKVSCGQPLLLPPARAHKSTSGCGALTAKKTCPSAAEVGSLSERKRELAELAAAAHQRPTQTPAGANRAARAGQTANTLLLLRSLRSRGVPTTCTLLRSLACCFARSHAASLAPPC